MEINRSAGYITFWLTHELNRPQDIWNGFINDLKEAIPHYYREYNPDTKEWIFPDKYYPIFTKLREKWFADENQTNIFDVDE